MTILESRQQPTTVDTDLRSIGDAITAAAPGAREARTLDRRHWQEAADAGLWLSPLPIKFGGNGGGWESFVKDFRALASRTDDLGFLLSAIAHAGALRSLLELGTDEQKRRFLPILTNGGVASTAFTEPGGGSDVRHFHATANSDGNGGWMISGVKSHITNAPVANVVIALVRFESAEPRPLTLTIVESDRRGLHRDAPEHAMGVPTSPTGDLLFDSVPISEQCILGQIGEGLSNSYRMFCFDRALYAVAAAEVQANLARRALRRCRNRTSFGSDLADHQYVQGRIVDIIEGAKISSALADKALESIDQSSPQASADASIAKLVATESLVRSAQHAMLLHGHSGFLDGPISWNVADSLGTLIAGGTSDIQRKNIFSQFERNEGALW